jgi:hypothetical protein
MSGHGTPIFFPAGEERLVFLKEMLSEGQFRVVENELNPEGTILDTFTTSMLVQIAEALSAPQREKFLNLPLWRMVDVGWSVAKRCST